MKGDAGLVGCLVDKIATRVCYEDSLRTYTRLNILPNNNVPGTSLQAFS